MELEVAVSQHCTSTLQSGQQSETSSKKKRKVLLLSIKPNFNVQSDNPLGDDKDKEISPFCSQVDTTFYIEDLKINNKLVFK